MDPQKRGPRMGLAASVLLLGGVLMALAVTSAAGAAGAATKTVTISASSYAPAVIEVNVGDTVTWKNDDLFPHTATSVDRYFDSRQIAVGATWSYHATSKGEYPYICTLHPTMRGVVRVR
jgi:plastocyanin